MSAAHDQYSGRLLGCIIIPLAVLIGASEAATVHNGHGPAYINSER